MQLTDLPHVASPQGEALHLQHGPYTLEVEGWTTDKGSMVYGGWPDATYVRVSIFSQGGTYCYRWGTSAHVTNMEKLVSLLLLEAPLPYEWEEVTDGST